MPFGLAKPSLSHCLQLLLVRHGSSCVLQPPFAQHSFHYASLHHVRCFPFAPGMAACPLSQNPINACCSFPFASIRTTLTGFRFAPFQSASLQAGFSPPAANNFARRRYPLGSGWQASVKARYLRPLRLQNAKPSLHSSAAFVPCGKYTPAASYGAGIAVRPSLLSCQPLVGARSRLRSFLPPAAFSARFARLTLQPPLLPAALLFF